MVVGDDKYLARDAADAVEVDYDPMDAAVDLEDAATDRIQVHDASNVIHTWEAGTATAAPRPLAGTTWLWWSARWSTSASSRSQSSPGRCWLNGTPATAG